MSLKPQAGLHEPKSPPFISQGMPFAGRQYPDIIEFGRDYDHLLDVRITDLSVEVLPGPPRQFVPITQTLGVGDPDNRWYPVAEIQVPPNYKPTLVIVEAALSDPALEELFTPPTATTPYIPAVQFKVTIDKNEVGKPFGAAPNRPLKFGVMSRTANGPTVRVMAFVSSALWSTPPGATPIRSLIQSFVSLEVIAVMDQPEGD